MKKTKVLILYVLILAVVPLAQAQTESPYQFHEHLSGAQAFLIKYSAPDRDYEAKKSEIKIGQWREDKIIFDGMADEAPIMVSSYDYENIQESGIFFPPTPGQIKSLQFYDVPPTGKLAIYYGIDDLGVQADVHATLYVTIWVGKHKIGRLLVPYERGWKREVFFLEEAVFLKKPVVITFEITTDNPAARRFSFRPEMQD